MRDDRHPGARLLAALLGLALVPALLGGSGGPCATATPSASLAAADEPGERLVVTGTVYAPDGTTPAPGVFLYAYNTDATGHYAKESGAPPRLHGWMKTGPDGRYEYRTIRPAPYPGRTIAAHVHTQLWGGGYPPQSGELLFAGDPYLTTEEKEKSEKLGRFALIQPLRRDAQGVWHAVQDIRLRSTGDRFGSNIQHGAEPCGLRF